MRKKLFSSEELRENDITKDDEANEPTFASSAPGSQRWLRCIFRSPTSFTRFLASNIGAKANLSDVFGLKHVNGKYSDALELWFELTLENKIQKPIFVKEISQMNLKFEPTDVTKFNAC